MDLLLQLWTAFAGNLTLDNLYLLLGLILPAVVQHIKNAVNDPADPALQGGVVYTVTLLLCVASAGLFLLVSGQLSGVDPNSLASLLSAGLQVFAISLTVYKYGFDKVKDLAGPAPAGFSPDEIETKGSGFWRFVATLLGLKL